VNNLSSVSMNGTIPAFGNFQIESSLLKSIISSGGSITTSPDVRNCLNIPNQNHVVFSSHLKWHQLEVNSVTYCSTMRLYVIWK
jgi:hypothetical protein